MKTKSPFPSQATCVQCFLSDGFIVNYAKFKFIVVLSISRNHEHEESRINELIQRSQAHKMIGFYIKLLDLCALIYYLLVSTVGIYHGIGISFDCPCRLTTRRLIVGSCKSAPHASRPSAGLEGLAHLMIEC